MTGPRGGLALFVTVAFALSWLAWAPLTHAALTGGHAWSYWHLFGGLGPALGALLVARREGRAAFAGLLQRLDPRRCDPRWLVLALLAPVALYLAGASVLALTGQGWPRLADFGASREYPELGRPAYWAANLLFYGVGEEVGWRGYLLPRLQRRWTARSAAAVVTLIWAAWHLPLFAFAAGMRAMGPAEIAGWLFSLLIGSYLLTWLSNASGSIAPAVLFHAALDITIGSPGHPMTANLMGALLSIAGMALAIGAGRDLRWPAVPRGASRQARVLKPEGTT